MSIPSVSVKGSVADYIREHAHEEARKFGWEILGWLVGFSGDNEVYVLRGVKCTKYRRQSRIEAEADPSQESEVASKYPRNIGLVGLYHSHPFRSDYRRPHPGRGFDEKMFHSEIDSTSLRSRASREENYLSVVTDGKNITFFALDKDSKKVTDLKPQMLDVIEYDKFLTSYRSKINLVFEKKFSAGSIGDIIKELEGYLINYIYRNIEESEVKFKKLNERKWNVRLYAFEEKAVGDNVIRIERNGDSYLVNLKLRMEPEVFVTRKKEVLRALRDEIADNLLYLIRKSFESSLLGKGNIKLLELHLGNFKVEKKEFPIKVYVPPKRRLIMKRG